MRQNRQLLVSFKPNQLGRKVTRTTVSRWIRDTICMAYWQMGQDIPLAVRAHSTQAMAASLADIQGVTPSDLCAAATWSSSNVFAKHYRLDLAASSGIATQVLQAAVADCCR